MIKESAKKELAQLPISEKELCDRYEKTWTPAVNDVLREMGLHRADTS